MSNPVTVWFYRHFSDPQAIVLTAILIIGFGVILTLGDLLAPVLASLVLAYLLDSLVVLLERRGVARLIAFMVVFVLFLAVLVLTMFGLLPILSKQLTQFVQLAPAIVAKGQSLLMQLPQHYPEVFTADQVNNLVAGIHTEIAGLGQDVVSLSLNTVLDIVTVGVYLVLMPIMVFFFLKDKHKIQQWVTGYLPKRRDVANEVWTEMDLQLGNYVRGKSWEFLVMWVVDYIAFVILDLRFAMLLSVLVGISVIVPYIGMVAVTIPVVLVAYFQWGLTSDFYTLLIVFFIIQAIDGNVLVPLLFSEVVNIHPIGIIVAILVFGGIWGMWGVFFAIPLATLIKSLLNAWPTLPDPDEAGSPT